MEIKMKNNYLLCKVEEDMQETTGGFTVKNLSRFREVEVIASSQEDVPVGSKIKISVNAGEEDEEGLVIKSSDIIYIL